MSEATATAYLLACRDEREPEVLMFASPAERGAWASAHTRETGHDSWLVRDGGEITVLFIAECLDCQDFVRLMDAADVLDRREPPDGGGALRVTARAILAMGTSGMADAFGDLLLQYRAVPPQPFAVAAERDRWAGTHSAATGHVVGKRAEFR